MSTEGRATLDDDRAILHVLCETFLPALPTTSEQPAVRAYYEDGAIARGIADAVVAALADASAPVATAVATLLATLRERGFVALDLDARHALLVDLARTDDTARLAWKTVRGMTLGPFIGAVDAAGTNPVWPVVGYPGPPPRPRSGDEAPGRIAVVEPGSDAVLRADVCVVGSGAGGAVIAARAAEAGRSVVVLEAGAYRTEDSFDQVDLHAADMFLRRGAFWSDTSRMGILAGSVLGGGTLINSMVCLRTPDDIRAAWAEAGLTGLDTLEFDKHLDAVWHRLDVNTAMTSYNANTRAMITGLASNGYRHERLPRNAASTDDPARCGLCNAGCQLGCKRSTLHTYLQDAVAAGARVVVGCRVERIDAWGNGPRIVHGVLGGRPLTVEATDVVVAAGGIESPALLLRSGLGGPAVGHHLRLHPAWIVTGVYDEPVEAWSGQIQSAVSFDLTRCEEGTGFLVESLALNPLTWAAQTPARSPRAHRDRLRDLPYFATWHGVSHDHGAGRVYLDAEGEAAVRWELDDDVDRRVARRAHLELARMHRDAGAREVFTFHLTDHTWRRGEDFDAYLDELGSVPWSEYTAFSAHQMGACRLGADPTTSVADGQGQLHDTPGVWIGDASALPGAPGVNPMITIMALAERTAQALLAARPRP